MGLQGQSLKGSWRSWELSAGTVKVEICDCILERMNKMISNWIVRLHQKKVKYLFGLIEPFLTKKGKILDLGTGSGELAKKLLEEGFAVTPVDVVDKVKVSGVKVTVYDGKNLPFKDKEFGQTLLITVLHHVPEYQDLLREVARVSREVIIVEDVYENAWDKFNIRLWDSVLNLEFFGHPHNNRSDSEWKNIFVNMGWKILAEKKGSIREVIYAFKQKAYRLLV